MSPEINRDDVLTQLFDPSATFFFGHPVRYFHHMLKGV
jgi:hypothetical protein